MKDELKEVMKLADDLRSRAKKIIKKLKADADTDDFHELPPGFEIECAGDEFICPNCEGHVRKSLLKGNWCCHCGQRLDWSGE